MDAEASVEVRDLKKRYGDLEAVRGVTFDVAPGETFGFLGPNGAGKTTTISMLCTLITPTGGSARVAGFDGEGPARGPAPDRAGLPGPHARRVPDRVREPAVPRRAVPHAEGALRSALEVAYRDVFSLGHRRC